MQTKFGFGGENLDFITAFSQLRINGSLRDTETIPIRYEVSVPEPSIILGLVSALGFGTHFKRKLKSSKSTEKNTKVS